MGCFCAGCWWRVLLSRALAQQKDMPPARLFLCAWSIDTLHSQLRNSFVRPKGPVPPQLRASSFRHCNAVAVLGTCHHAAGGLLASACPGSRPFHFLKRMMTLRCALLTISKLLFCMRCQQQGMLGSVTSRTSGPTPLPPGIIYTAVGCNRADMTYDSPIWLHPGTGHRQCSG